MDKLLGNKKTKQKSNAFPVKLLEEWDIVVNKIRKLTGREPLEKETNESTEKIYKIYRG